jgi:hypothetical protein
MKISTLKHESDYQKRNNRGGKNAFRVIKSGIFLNDAEKMKNLVIQVMVMV